MILRLCLRQALVKSGGMPTGNPELVLYSQSLRKRLPRQGMGSSASHGVLWGTAGAPGLQASHPSASPNWSMVGRRYTCLPMKIRGSRAAFLSAVFIPVDEVSLKPFVKLIFLSGTKTCKGLI